MICQYTECLSIGKRYASFGIVLQIVSDICGMVNDFAACFDKFYSMGEWLDQATFFRRRNNTFNLFSVFLQSIRYDILFRRRIINIAVFT